VGLGQNLVAVADAGPLIHLGEIAALPLLRVFSLVHVPNTVWDEAVARGRVDRPTLENAANVRRHAIDAAALQQFTQEVGPFSFHPGETEALLLCRRLDVPLLLTDDLAARDEARRQGVRPVGSLGIVVRAYHIGCIPLEKAEDLIQQLCRVSSLFVTKAIADLAVNQLRQTR
jgi:predicted nucleic acid-binding protein